MQFQLFTESCFQQYFWVALSLCSHLWPLFRHIFYGFVTPGRICPVETRFCEHELGPSLLRKHASEKSHNKMQQQYIRKVLLQLEAFTSKTLPWPLQRQLLSHFSVKMMIFALVECYINGDFYICPSVLRKHSSASEGEEP